MTHKVDLSMCSSRFTVEIEGDTPEEIRTNITNLIRNRMQEVWTVSVFDKEGMLREIIDDFLVVREGDQFMLQTSKNFMNPSRLAEA